MNIYSLNNQTGNFQNLKNNAKNDSASSFRASIENKTNPVKEFSYIKPEYYSAYNPSMLNIDIKRGGGVSKNGFLKPVSNSVSFTGLYPTLKKMTAISPDGECYAIKKSKDGSYLVDSETVTKIYYGKDAINYLKNREDFDCETQVISQHDSKLKLTDKGKEVKLDSNGAIIISKGAKAKIDVLEGYPLVITSEREPIWYEKYKSDTKNRIHRQKFEELTAINAHAYKGHLKQSDLGDKITDKLVESGLAEKTADDFLEFTRYYNVKFLKQELKKNGFTNPEIQIITHFYEPARKLRLSTNPASWAQADNLPNDVKDALIQADMMLDISKGDEKRVFWKRAFSSEFEFVREMKNCKVPEDIQKKAVKFWLSTNKLGFDYSGLKYISDGVAVYNLEDKINNWTNGSTEWNSHSLEAVSTKEGLTTPYIGVSDVAAKKDYEHAIPFKDIRKAEVLHSHPNLIDKKQAEIYMITQGAAAITVIENDKPNAVILKEGEAIVIQPGVKHCVSAVKGNYEHLVCQIPSTFQYGFDFKINQHYPDNYTENTVTQMAVDKLEKAKI